MPTVEKSIDVDVPVTTAYNQWTQFESFPRFMQGVESVEQFDERHLHWRVNINGNVREWDAEITEQKPEDRIAWHSVEGAPNAGVVTFHRITPDSCRVMLQLEYQPNGMVESLGDMLGLISRQIESDLNRFKEFIERQGIESGAWRGTIDAPESNQLDRQAAPQYPQSPEVQATTYSGFAATEATPSTASGLVDPSALASNAMPQGDLDWPGSGLSDSESVGRPYGADAREDTSVLAGSEYPNTVGMSAPEPQQIGEANQEARLGEYGLDRTESDGIGTNDSLGGEGYETGTQGGEPPTEPGRISGTDFSRGIEYPLKNEDDLPNTAGGGDAQPAPVGVPTESEDEPNT